MERTYILTAELDDASFAWLDGLRRKHFPRERNFLPAHLTLFYRLSSRQTAGLDDFELPDGSVPFLMSAPCMAANSRNKDGQSWRPDVTIQNKVPAEAAKELYRTIEFKPLARRKLGPSGPGPSARLKARFALHTNSATQTRLFLKPAPMLKPCWYARPTNS